MEAFLASSASSICSVISLVPRQSPRQPNFGQEDDISVDLNYSDRGIGRILVGDLMAIAAEGEIRCKEIWRRIAEIQPVPRKRSEAIVCADGHS